MPIVERFNKDFKMKIKPSDSLVPPKVDISPEFIQWLERLNNWQLIGM